MWEQAGETCLPSFVQASAIPAHEFFHAAQGLFYLLIRGRVTHAHKAAAAGTECIARYHGYMFLEQQFLGEGLIVHAGGLDVGERVERAARLERVQPETVESCDQ